MSYLLLYVLLYGIITAIIVFNAFDMMYVVINYNESILRTYSTIYMITNYGILILHILKYKLFLLKKLRY